MKTSNSILDGVHVLVDDWLELTSRGKPPLYGHKSAAIQLSEQQVIPPASDFLQAAYKQIDGTDKLTYFRSKSGNFKPISLTNSAQSEA